MQHGCRALQGGLLWLFVVAALGLSVRVVGPQLAASAERTATAPFTFRFPDLDGRIVDAADLRGHVVLVNIFATWCPPCGKEMLALQRLAEAYKDQGLVVIGIALDRPGLMGLAKDLNLRDHLRRYVAKLQVSYPILMAENAITMQDGMMVVNDLGGVAGIPTTYILDRAGSILETIIGFRKAAVFEQAVQRALPH